VCLCLQREVLMKELDRERQLRIEAETRLRNERLDVCDCKSHATELQKELARLKPDSLMLLFVYFINTVISHLLRL